MCHSNDELAVLFRKLFEKFPLQKLDVDNGERAAISLRGKDVTVPDGNGNLDRFHLGLTERRVPSIGLGEGGTQHRIGVLRGVAGCEGEPGEDGRAEDLRNVGGGVHYKGLAGCLFRVEGECDGDEYGGDRGGSPLCRVATCERVRAQTCGELEGWDGALRVRALQRQAKEKERAGRLNSHIQPQTSDTE